MLESKINKILPTVEPVLSLFKLKTANSGQYTTTAYILQKPFL